MAMCAAEHLPIPQLFVCLLHCNWNCKKFPPTTEESTAAGYIRHHAMIFRVSPSSSLSKSGAKQAEHQEMNRNLAISRPPIVVSGHGASSTKLPTNCPWWYSSRCSPHPVPPRSHPVPPGPIRYHPVPPPHIFFQTTACLSSTEMVAHMATRLPPTIGERHAGSRFCPDQLRGWQHQHEDQPSGDCRPADAKNGKFHPFRLWHATCGQGPLYHL